MKIRSLIRVRLTKYFKPDVYILNRCPEADGILVDMERKSIDDEYKRKSLQFLQKSPYHPRIPTILLDTVSNKPNPWMTELMKNPASKIRGIAIRSTVDTINENIQGLDPKIRQNDTVFTMIWDVEQQRITHSVVSYHMINDNDILWSSRLRTAARNSILNNIQPLAARTCRFRDNESAIYEFLLLKQIGFSGVVLRNPNLIEMTNKIFN